MPKSKTPINNQAHTENTENTEVVGVVNNSVWSRCKEYFQLLYWSSYSPYLLAILFFSLILCTFFVLNILIHEQQRTRFNREISAHVSLLRTRFDDFERVLQSTRAFWLSGESAPNHKTFYKFADDLEFSQRFPEIQALGFLTWLPECQPKDINALRRSMNMPNLRVSPRRKAEACTPVTYIYPQTKMNRNIEGYNAYYEKRRKDSINVMKSTSAMQTSLPVVLEQYKRYQDDQDKNTSVGGDKKSVGFLLMLPIWQNEGGSIGIAGHDQLKGFVYLAIRSYDMLALLEDTVKERKAWLNGVKSTEIAEIVSSVQLGGIKLNQKVGKTGVLQHTEVLRLAGQDWQINYVASDKFGWDRMSYLPLTFLIVGIAISLLFYVIMGAQIKARQRTEKVNADLIDAKANQEKSHAEFEAIFKSMQDGAVFTDEQGYIRMVNPAITKQFGYKDSELIGQPLDVLYRGTDTLDTGNVIMTNPLHHKDGHQFYAEIQKTAVLDRRGGTLGHLEVIRDVSERLKSEKALRATERHARASLDAIPHIVWVSDVHGKMVDANALYRMRLDSRQVRDRIHYEDLKAYDEMWRDVYILQTRASCTARIKVNVQRKNPKEEQSTWFARDRWFDIEVAPLLGEEGKPSQWVVSATDTHDRVLAERVAQRNEERYRGVIESMPQIVWLTDTHGNPTYVNKRWTEYVGQENKRQTFIEAMPDEDREKFQSHWIKAVRRNEPFEAEHRLLGADGLYRTFVTRGLPVLDNSGRLIEWVGTCTDVDDNVYAENASRLLADISEALIPDPTQPAIKLMSFENGRWRSERYSRALKLLGERVFQAAALWTTDRLLADIIHLNDRESTTSPLNDQLKSTDENGEMTKLDHKPEASTKQPTTSTEENTNWKPHDKVIRLAVSDFGDHWNNEEIQDFMVDLIKQVIKIGRGLETNPEIIAMHPILRQLKFDAAKLVPLFDSSGKMLAILGIANHHTFSQRDDELVEEITKRFATSLEGDSLRIQAEVTQQKMVMFNQSLEGRVKRRTEELQQINQELEAFSYSVSHDLSSPLRQIVGLSEVVITDKESDLSDKSARYANLINESALRLIRQVESLLGFYRNSRKPIEKRLVKLNRVIEKTWSLLESDRKGREIQFSVDKLPELHADPSLIELVFQNILSNAIKYTGKSKDAIISIESEEDEKWLFIHIKDNGVGFDTKYSDKLFGVFQRLHSPKEFEGTGVGLANVRRIIVRHGGNVSASGKVGEGAIFTIQLPFQEINDTEES